MSFLDLGGFEIVIIFGLIGLSVYLFLQNKKLEMSFEKRVKDFLDENEEKIRKDAISRSARTLSGKTLEKLIPFLEKFEHNPHDVRWIGDPVDLVVFDGYSESGRKDVDGVTFVEIKSGESKLHTGQRKIKDAVKKGKVRWEEFRI